MNTILMTKAARYLLYALILFAVINIISNFMQISLMNSYFVYSEFSDEVFDVLADKNDTRQGIIDIIYGLLLVSSYFIIGRWIYLSSKVNHLLGIKNLQYSPGWCVGWYFIPFANLFKPYQALKEIYRASFNKEDWEKEEIPSSFGVWWGTFLLSNLLSNRSARNWLSLGEDYSYEDLNFISSLDMTSDFFQIICSLVLLNIIDSISKNHQNIKFKTSYKQETKIV